MTKLKKNDVVAPIESNTTPIDNPTFLVINSDDVGSDIGEHISNDDVQGLAATSQKFTETRQQIDEMVQGLGGEVIFSTGDESLYQLPVELGDSVINQIQQVYTELTGKTLTMGSGPTLSQAYKALIAGKSNGKNQYNTFSPEMDQEDETMDQEAPDDSVPAGSDEDSFVEGQEVPTEQENFSQPVDAKAPNPMDAETQKTPQEPAFPNDAAMATPAEPTMAQVDPMSAQPVAPIAEASPEKESEEWVDDDSSEEIPGAESQESPMTDGSTDDSSVPGSAADEDTSELMDGQAIPDDSVDPGFDQESEDMGSDEDTQALKMKVSQVLEQFRQNKDVIEQSMQTNPQAYQATMSMLQAMIEMAKKLSVSDDVISDAQDDETEMENEAPTDEETEIQDTIAQVAQPKEKSDPKKSGKPL